MKGRIVIPLHDPWGRLIGYAGRVVDEGAINEDTPRYLFPSHRERNGARYEFHKSEFFQEVEKTINKIADNHLETGNTLLKEGSD